MAQSVDFATVKAHVSITQVMELLRINHLTQRGNQLRGICPICNQGPRTFVVTPELGLYNCFKGCGGGDCIKLYASMKHVSQKDAALAIAEHFSVGTPPQNRNEKQDEPKGTKTLTALDYLQPEHERVQALGIPPETAKAKGIGYAPKGTMRNRVLFPIYAENGTLIAYAGHGEDPLWQLPKDWEPLTIINAQQIDTGCDLYLVRDPLAVVEAVRNGVTNVVAIMGDLTPDALTELVEFMRRKENPALELV